MASSLILTASAVAISLQGCNPGQTLQPLPQSEVGGNQSLGGEASTIGGGGGLPGGGATSGNGGTPGNGGTTSALPTGGASVTATGGTNVGNPTGGNAAATGGYGVTTTGGAKPTGGTTSVIGATGGYANTATGGYIATETGGAPIVTATGGAASNPTDCKLAASPGSFTVSGVAYVVDGTCEGYGFAFASKSGGDAAAAAPSISPCTDKSGCTVTAFADTNKLCATSGTVTPSSDYGATAGIGFALNQTPTGTKGTMMPTGTGLQISFTVGTKPAVLRAQISDNAATPVSYCFDISTATSPVQIPWASFNTTCWDLKATGSKAFASTTPISQVQLIVPGDGTGAAPAGTTRTFTNLCLAGVSTY